MRTNFLHWQRILVWLVIIVIALLALYFVLEEFAAVALPDGFVSQNYSGGIDEGIVVGALPLGLQIGLSVHGCVPPETTCGTPDALTGIPTQEGTYRFMIVSNFVFWHPYVVTISKIEPQE